MVLQHHSHTFEWEVSLKSLSYTGCHWKKESGCESWPASVTPYAPCLVSLTLSEWLDLPGLPVFSGDDKIAAVGGTRWFHIFKAPQTMPGASLSAVKRAEGSVLFFMSLPGAAAQYSLTLFLKGKTELLSGGFWRMAAASHRCRVKTESLSFVLVTWPLMTSQPHLSPCISGRPPYFPEEELFLPDVCTRCLFWRLSVPHPSSPNTLLPLSHPDGHVGILPPGSPQDPSSPALA